ncbi:S-layer homology domain-containing protein [Bacillus benzoevorans]|uniref:SLH domain-containing protein n=1 Tax=Bacillus benzoevorans TaxID=1456 RepID=A0A7X0HRK0_9BACI|nr:S-layer homology domain-containing protein [Bacillus benzoevorans]MBB6444482.1 hypothetical protein [Bacillus benzoevorans]
MRRFFSLFIILLIFFLAVPMTGLASGTFRDVSKTYTFYKEVEFLSSKQIITGFQGGIFRPDVQVTRAEAAIMIGRALGLNGEPRNTKFSDVTANVTGSGYIAAAVEKKIITGYSDGTYHPHENISRGQMAIILDRAFNLEDRHLSNPFQDISPSKAAYQSILNAYALGIANGYSDGTYRPEATVSRGHFSAFLTRALEPSFRGKPTFAIESVSGWEPGSSVAEVDIAHEWVVKFNDELDENWRNFENLRKNMYVVRERDNQRLDIFNPIISRDDPTSITLGLTALYDRNETYYLYITKDMTSKMGNPLAKPLKLKFHTNGPEYTINQTIEQDGIKLELAIDQSEEKVFAKVKATNVSSEPISYFGTNGCDKGIAADLFTDTKDGPVKIGSKWAPSGIACTLMIEHYVLQPGATIEILEVLYPPAEPVNGNIYVKAIFKREIDKSNPLIKPAEISIPLEKF